MRMRASIMQNKTPRGRVGFTGSAGIMHSLTTATFEEKIQKHQKSAHSGLFVECCPACIELRDKREKHETSWEEQVSRVESASVESELEHVQQVQDIPQRRSESRQSSVEKQADTTPPRTKAALKVIGKTMTWLRMQSAHDLRQMKGPETIVNENEQIAVLVPYSIFEAMAKRIAGAKEN